MSPKCYVMCVCVTEMHLPGQIHESGNTVNKRWSFAPKSEKKQSKKKTPDASFNDIWCVCK